MWNRVDQLLHAWMCHRQQVLQTKLAWRIEEVNKARTAASQWEERARSATHAQTIRERQLRDSERLVRLAHDLLGRNAVSRCEVGSWRDDYNQYQLNKRYPHRDAD